MASKFKIFQFICHSLSKFQFNWEIFSYFLAFFENLNLKYTTESCFILECEKSGPKSVVRRRSSRLRIFSKRKTIVNFWCHPLFMHSQNTRQHFMKVFSVFVWSGVLGLKRAVSHAHMDARTLLCFFKLVSRANNWKSCPPNKWHRHKNVSIGNFFEQTTLHTCGFWAEEDLETWTWDYLNITLAQKWHFTFSKFLQKKVSRLEKRNFLYFLNECRGLTTWFLQITTPEVG